MERPEFGSVHTKVVPEATPVATQVNVMASMRLALVDADTADPSGVYGPGPLPDGPIPDIPSMYIVTACDSEKKKKMIKYYIKRLTIM